MVAGFFRLKDRTARRPGYAVDSLPVHFWKRAKEITSLLITWAKFLKEMEEVWLQTRKKSETEERWLEQLQKIQSIFGSALRIGDIQKSTATPKKPCRNGQERCSNRSRIFRRGLFPAADDLNRFLRQWDGLRARASKSFGRGKVKRPRHGSMRSTAFRRAFASATASKNGRKPTPQLRESLAVESATEPGQVRCDQ